jgi:hypothetical protein
MHDLCMYTSNLGAFFGCKTLQNRSKCVFFILVLLVDPRDRFRLSDLQRLHIKHSITY